ncbi:MAG: regulatory protein RecX [Actinomycetota bacterium]
MPAASRARNPKGCHERALGLLAVRARSRRELERRLLQAGFPAGEVDAELVRLEAVGLVDDREFARQLARHELVGRRSGTRAVVSALAAKGVAPDLVAATLAELDDDPEGRAERLARSRLGRLRGLDEAAAFHRLAGFLMRRGYDPGTSRAVARRVLEPRGALGDD